MELSTIGLWILVVAWLVQAFYSLKGKKEIQTMFLATYALGGLVLVADGFDGSTLNVRSIQNLVIVALIAVILVKSAKK